MYRLALKMIIGDKAKFIGITLGLVFATFIITQQAGIFVGLMQRTYGFISDTTQPNIWVMDPDVQHADDVKAMRSTDLDRVKSISGVRWAVPMYKGLLKARLDQGQYQICTVVGIDDATLIGGPPIMLKGSIRNLRNPDAVIINHTGAKKKLREIDPNNPKKSYPIQMGRTFEINDRRAQVAGFCRLMRTFFSYPVIYTSFSNAIDYAPQERNLLSFVLAYTDDQPEKIARKIHQITGLAAYTPKEFKKKTLNYYMTQTGIPINFGVAVLLGFIIGTAIAGQTFYNFAYDNLRYFATLKAMGCTKKMLIKIILTQALLVAFIGWGIGIGLTACFGLFASNTELSFVLPYWLYILSLLSICLITLFAAFISIRKILKVDPAIVFQQ